MEAPLGPWTSDPASFDRTVEGDLPADVVAARAKQIAADDALAARVAVRKRYLDALAQAGAQWRAGLPEATPAELEAQVRARLHGVRTARPRGGWLRYAAAASVLIGIGLLALFTAPTHVTAVPQGVLDAAALLDTGAPFDPATGGCESTPGNPHDFPTVRSGELRVANCGQDDPAPSAEQRAVRARLLGGVSPERAEGFDVQPLTVVGYVAVPEPGTKPSARIGKTDLGDTIVYDVLYDQTRAYLAVKKSLVVKRGECAACHNGSREGQANPHYIELRRWKR